MTEDRPTAVFAAVSQVIGALPAIGKDREMQDGPRYKYRSIEQIKEALKPLLTEHGLFYTPHRIIETVDSEYPVGQKTWQRVRTRVLWRVYASDGSFIEADPDHQRPPEADRPVPEWEAKVVQGGVLTEIRNEIGVGLEAGRDLARRAWATVVTDERESWPVGEAQALIAACVTEAVSLHGADQALEADQ